MFGIIAKAKAGIAVAKAVAVANAPLGLFVGGIVVGVAAVIAVAKAAVDSKTEMEQELDKMEQISDELRDPEITDETDIKELKIEKKEAVKSTAKTFFRYYWKGLLLLTISGGLLAGGFFWQSRRFAVAAATATTQAALIKTMERNIQRTYGDKALNAMQDPDWDPNILKKEEASDTSTTATKGYDDPYRDYKIDKSDPSRSLYLINKYTIDPSVFPVECSAPYNRDIQPIEIVNALIRLQAILNGSLPKHTFYSETNLLDAIGYVGFKSTTLDSLTRGWGPKDYIDFGLGDIFKELSQNCGDDTFMDNFNEKYKDGIPIRLNSSYNIPNTKYDMTRRIVS